MINALVTQNLIFNKSKNIYQSELTLDINEYFIKQNIFLIPISNSLISKKKIENFIEKFEIKLLILTGGNDIPINKKKSIRDILELRLIEISIKKKIKILGICRGMQILNYYYSGKIKKIYNHVRVKHKINVISKFKKALPTIVNSFHNYGILKKGLSANFSPIAFDKNENVEAFIDKEFRILGIMWHPERDQKIKKDFYFIKKFVND